MPALKPTTPGQKFGRLTIIKGHSWGNPLCECRCDCGKSVVLEVERLRSGNTKSCGCFLADIRGTLALKHGHARDNFVSPTYKSWTAMVRRVSRDENYKKRGIKVCKTWEVSFNTFLVDMGERPIGTTLDRRDNNKDYAPGNCRWATRKEQARNTSRNKYLEFRGEVHSMVEWSEILGLSYTAIKQRINKSRWSIERALTTPVNGFL